VAVSLNISIDSFSMASRTEGDEITVSSVVGGVFGEGLVAVKWKRCQILGIPAFVAQRIEHLTTDQKVGGSSPSKRTVCWTVNPYPNRVREA